MNFISISMNCKPIKHQNNMHLLKLFSALKIYVVLKISQILQHIAGQGKIHLKSSFVQ